MKINNKTLRQLRRALRREATYLVKFRRLQPYQDRIF
jgi:hypothetical protein